MIFIFLSPFVLPLSIHPTFLAFLMVPEMTLGALALSCHVSLQWDGEFRCLPPTEVAKGG